MVIIIGAGLSGLLTGYRLKQAGIKVRILEARDRIGGRIHSVVGHDGIPLEMGATWFGAKHKHLLALLEELGIDHFPQYMKGKAFFQAVPNAPAEAFDIPEQEPSYRIAGGTGEIIDKLAGFFEEDELLTGHPVTRIELLEMDGSKLGSGSEDQHGGNEVIDLVEADSGAEGDIIDLVEMGSGSEIGTTDLMGNDPGSVVGTSDHVEMGSGSEVGTTDLMGNDPGSVVGTSDHVELGSDSRKRAIELVEAGSGSKDGDVFRRENLVQKAGKIKVQTTHQSFTADQVVLCLPPKLWAEQIRFFPNLPEEVSEVAQITQTWMEESIKVALVYDTPFWREANLSGVLFSHTGPMIELYDHSNVEETKYSLCGFMHPGYWELNPTQRRSMVVEQLTDLFGQEVSNYTDYQETVWPRERFTANPLPHNLFPHQNNGHKIYEDPVWDGRLWFSGSETSPEFGGYMDGAVYAANTIAGKVIIQVLSSSTSDQNLS